MRAVESRAERCREAAVREAGYLRLCRLLTMSRTELNAVLAGEPADIAAWITTAADYGTPWAQLQLGQRLLDGVGVAADPARALIWFQRAARSGLAEAWNMLGRCHENGWGTEPDQVAAAHCYGLSAGAGHDWGQYNYAHLWLEGRGVPRDPAQALHWYGQAARQGHARAMNLLARCLEEGWGTPRDGVTAACWYRRSAEAGYFRGQFNHAAVLAAHGRTDEARTWFERALAGAPPAQKVSLARVLGGHAMVELAALGREAAGS